MAQSKQQRPMTRLCVACAIKITLNDCNDVLSLARKQYQRLRTCTHICYKCVSISYVTVHVTERRKDGSDVIPGGGMFGKWHYKIDSDWALNLFKDCKLYNWQR